MKSKEQEKYEGIQINLDEQQLGRILRENLLAILFDEQHKEDLVRQSIELLFTKPDSFGGKSILEKATERALGEVAMKAVSELFKEDSIQSSVRTAITDVCNQVFNNKEVVDSFGKIISVSITKAFRETARWV